MFDPACEQPLWRVECDVIERHILRASFARSPAQYGINKRCITRGMAVRLHKAHREIDRCMISDVEQENLRGAEKERDLDDRLIRHAALGVALYEMAQRTEPAQRSRDQLARQRAVPLIQCSQRAGFAIELFVKRPALAQHRLQYFGGKRADREPGNGRRTRCCAHHSLSPSWPGWSPAPIQCLGLKT
jgi:hypothetical protein